MSMTFKIMLMILISSAPDGHGVYFYEYPTWEECVRVEVETMLELCANRINPEAVTVSCRRDVTVTATAP